MVVNLIEMAENTEVAFTITILDMNTAVEILGGAGFGLLALYTLLGFGLAMFISLT
jgi:hypothetical protein